MAQLQNLLVTGDSRFLNEINGKIDWSNILNTPESKAAVSGGTDVSLVTTGEKYEWNNADTVVDQLIPDATASTISYPLLMSSASISNETPSYNGDIYRNNKVYCNPSSGTIHCGWIQAESPDQYKYDACQISAENFQGKIGLLTQTKVNSNNELMGITTTDAAGTAHFMIYRPSGGTNTAYNTPGTYIGGYDYNNDWSTFLVQGRSAHYWGTIPAVQANNGRMHVGAILDFHIASGSTNEYNYRIRNTEDGAMTYSGTWTKASSVKIKENIKDMDLDEAKKIFNLRPVSFDYKEGFGQKDQRGLIAEEVAEVLPKLVVAEVGEEGTEEWCPASVDYIGVVPYLIKIVQEQQKEIDELKAKVG